MLSGDINLGDSMQFDFQIVYTSPSCTHHLLAHAINDSQTAGRAVVIVSEVTDESRVKQGDKMFSLFIFGSAFQFHDPMLRGTLDV